MAYFLTLDEAIDEVQVLMNDPGGLIFTDALITNWIKQAATDISSKTLCYETNDDDAIQLVDGTMEYTTPTDCIKVYAAVACKKGTPNTAQRGLIKIHPKQIAHLTSVASGDPIYWYEFGEKVGFYPVWATGGTVDHVGLLYSAVTEDITKISSQYQPFAILYACHKAKLMDGKPAQAAQYYQQYLNSLIFHRTDLYERGVDAKDEFKMPDRTVRVGQQG